MPIRDYKQRGGCMDFYWNSLLQSGDTQIPPDFEQLVQALRDRAFEDADIDDMMNEITKKFYLVRRED
jgi:hypothetical protein